MLLLACAGSAPAVVHYVDVNSTNATPPYTNWATAATNIQDAVDAAAAGEEIVVTNGTYRPIYVYKPLSVRSLNGPRSTIIDAGWSGRCVYLTNTASLSGFTLTNGIVAGAGYDAGGAGAYGGTLNHCTLTRNSAEFLGGGALACTLNNCALNGNYGATGGGSYACTLNNCTLTGNSAPYDYGGGSFACTLNNCTLTGNSAAGGGGAWFSTLNNCIVYLNTASQGTNYGSNCTLNYCCTTPDPGDIGNITNAPLFVDTNGWANLRLEPNSPCINAGNNAFAPAGPDLDGNPRIVGGTVDIGAYEYQSLSLINFGVVSTQAGFNITGQSNQVVIVETSSDLVNWSPLATNTLTGHPFPFGDPTPANLPRRFYRAQAQ